jgi:hypothetical protein
MNEFESIVLGHGYVKKDYGYTKLTKENTHWITLFKGREFQMYAYFTEDPDCNKIYDTGIINCLGSELSFLILLFTQNHN